MRKAEGDEAKANSIYPKHSIRRPEDFLKIRVFEAEAELLKEKAKEAQRAKAVEAEKKSVAKAKAKHCAIESLAKKFMFTSVGALLALLVLVILYWAY